MPGKYPVFFHPVLDCPFFVLYNKIKHLDEKGAGNTDTNRAKKAAEWFYGTVFRDEAIQPRRREPEAPVPEPILAARALETGVPAYRQSREAIFVKQAELLRSYEDDYVYERQVIRYFPTYQSLTDQELRGYFSWRTKLRRGDVRKTCLSFAFLYIYELLNRIGVEDPMDGYRKLRDFRDTFGKLEGAVVPYLNKWLMDYVVYYGLDPALLEDNPVVSFDKSLAVLADIKSYDDRRIMDAVAVLSPRSLEHSKFYKAYREDVDAVLPRVLRQIWEHCATRCKKTMVEQYFGPRVTYPVSLFDSAVFCFREKPSTCVFQVDEVRTYLCRNGFWSVEKYNCPPRPSVKLGRLVKTVDAVMRECYDYRYPIRREVETKWVIAVIEGEVRAYLAEKKAAEARKVTIDYSRLEKIRRDAAITRDRLSVEEEAEDDAPEETACQTPAVLSEPEGTGESLLSPAEYRLLQCLLYGGELGWVQAEGHLLSVLVDGVNEKLYDQFMDAVLDDSPALIEDYMDDLKGMVHP